MDFAFPVYLTSRDCKDTSVLSVAASTGNYELVKLLLDSGANPNGYFSDNPRSNIQSKDIPIVIAVKNNFIEVVSLLIDVDANIYVMEGGKNRRYHVPSETLLGIAISDQLIECVKLLIESAGADLNNGFHERLFGEAVDTKNEELILYLLKEGGVAAKSLDEV